MLYPHTDYDNGVSICDANNNNNDNGNANSLIDDADGQVSSNSDIYDNDDSFWRTFNGDS